MRIDYDYGSHCIIWIVMTGLVCSISTVYLILGGPTEFIDCDVYDVTDIRFDTYTGVYDFVAYYNISLDCDETKSMSYSSNIESKVMKKWKKYSEMLESNPNKCWYSPKYEGPCAAEIDGYKFGYPVAVIFFALSWIISITYFMCIWVSYYVNKANCCNKTDPEVDIETSSSSETSSSQIQIQFGVETPRE